MHKNQHSELLGLGPEGVELGVGQLVSVDVPSDGGAAQAQLLDAFLQLLGRQVGKLQRHRGEGYEAGAMPACGAALKRLQPVKTTPAAAPATSFKKSLRLGIVPSSMECSSREEEGQ